MERAIITLCFAAMLSGVAYADQFNDAFFGTEPDFSAEISSGAQIDSDGGGGGSGTTGGGSGALPAETPPADSDEEGTSDSSGNGGNGSAGSGSGSDSGSGIETEEELLILLVGQGALQIYDESSGLASSFFGTTLDGSKMRAAYRSDPDIAKVMRYWKGLSGEEREVVRGRLTTGQYYALVAAELASDDDGLEKAALSASRFEIRYRSRGELLWFIPWSFPVQVEVTTAAASGERVKVALPWYRWFIRKHFSGKGLAIEIETVVSSKIAELGPEANDTQAALFIAVTKYLRQKVRTISDSVLLGT